MNPNESRSASGVFISYRREDNSRWVRRLAPMLRERLGKHRVSLDIDFEPGHDWRKQIKEQLDSASMVLVLIGPKFLNVREPSGKRRLELEDDQVRLEIRTALVKEKLVFPILTDQASPPKDYDLPADIRHLAYLQTGRLDTTRDLDPICNRIERTLNNVEVNADLGYATDGFPFPRTQRPLRHKDPKIVRNLKNDAVNDLITAGWAIDNQSKDMVAVHEAHTHYRFRFDRKKPVIWLEENANAEPSTPNWKRVKNFSLEPSLSPTRIAGLEFSDLASAAINPAAFLGRKGKTKFGGARVAMVKAFYRPPVSVDWIKEQVARTPSYTSLETEQRSREAEKCRRAADGIHLEHHRDIDLGSDTVSGIQFSRTNNSLAIASWTKLRVDRSLMADPKDVLIKELEASIETMRWSVEGRLALGLYNGEIVLTSAEGSEQQRAPQLDGAWRRITESQMFAHAINALAWTGNGKLLFYSSNRFPLAYWDTTTGETAEAELLPTPKRRN